MEKNKTNVKITLLIGAVVLALSSLNIGNVYAQGEIHLDDRDNYSKVASAHYQKGEWEAGKKVVDEGLVKYPKDSDLKMLLGRYYYEQQMYDKARFELVEALKYNNNNTGAKQILVNVEIATVRYSSAICYINELLEVNPYWKELWRKKIDVYRLQGNTVEANRLLKRISQIYPDDVNIKTAYLHYTEEEAKARQDQGKIEEAIHLTTNLVEEDPKNEDYYIQLANNFLKAGDYDKALSTVEKGLFNLPSSTVLIDKKADIMGELHRYDEVLSFLQLKIKEGGNTAHLQRRYGYFLEEAARHQRNSDPYILYRKLYERNPQNEEAFNYIVSNAISRGFHEDALEVIAKAKSLKGDTKELLVKEKQVYELMGSQSKADQIMVILYQRFPEDTDILEQYVTYRFKQAKDNMSDELFDKALNHWMFIAEFGDQEQQKIALSSIYNCSYQMGKYNEALNVLNRLINEYPDELEWGLKRAVIYGKQKEYMVALNEYKRVINLADPFDMQRMLNGYDELAIEYTKQLVEEYQLKEAMKVIEHWLTVNPKSEHCIRYAVNISAQMKEYDNMVKYASLGLEYRPDDTFCQMKLAEAYNLQKQHEPSVNILSSEIVKNPYHQGLINANSQSSEDYARLLIKDMKYEEGLHLLDSALIFDPDNKSLKYWKGVAYEKLKIMDSAYHYQSFYEPSLMEYRDFDKHLRALKSRTFNNEIGIFHLRGRYSDLDVLSTISTVEYTRYGEKDTYVGRINYTGRQGGKGIQGQAEWTRNWRHDIYTRIDAALSNKFFARFMANASVYKVFKHDWEAQLGVGYRNLYDNDDNMINLVAGIAKEFDPWWLNVRFNSVLIGGEYYYNVFGQARFNIITPKSYLSVMGSVGSAPDIDAIDNQLYDGFSVTNSMVGVGMHHMINERLSAGIIGNLYNYEDKSYNFTEGDGKYRNFHNIYIQLHARF